MGSRHTELNNMDVARVTTLGGLTGLLLCVIRGRLFNGQKLESTGRDLETPKVSINPFECFAQLHLEALHQARSLQQHHGSTSVGKYSQY